MNLKQPSFVVLYIAASVTFPITLKMNVDIYSLFSFFAEQVISDSGFEVTRRILVDLGGISLRRKFINGLPPDNIHMMIGQTQ